MEITNVLKIIYKKKKINIKLQKIKYFMLNLVGFATFGFRVLILDSQKLQIPTLRPGVNLAGQLISL